MVIITMKKLDKSKLYSTPEFFDWYNILYIGSEDTIDYYLLFNKSSNDFFLQKIMDNNYRTESIAKSFHGQIIIFSEPYNLEAYKQFKKYMMLA
jgi:hypothetical protein